MASRLLSTTLIGPPANLNKSPAGLTARKGRVSFRAVSDSSQGSVAGTVYQGVYGPWTIEQSDVKEVFEVYVDLKLMPGEQAGVCGGIRGFGGDSERSIPTPFLTKTYQLVDDPIYD